MTKRMTLAAAFAVLAASAFAGYRYETTMTVAGYHDAENLANFPLLVRISESSVPGFAYANCQADGKDIRFTSLDGATTYPHEIDEWNAGGESLVWVRIPSLTAHMQFKMLFGDASIAAAPAYASDGSVWRDAGYFGVFHMNETENQGTASYTAIDSSPYHFDATPGKSHSSFVSVADGQIGLARTQGSSVYSGPALIGKNYGPLNVGDSFTVSGWVRLTLSGGIRQIFSRKNAIGDPGWSVAAVNYYVLYVYGGNGTYKSFNIGEFRNNWVHLAVVFNSGNATVYCNGVAKGTQALAAAVTENGRPFSFGNVSSMNGAASLEGGQDEFRLLDAVSSATWIKADWASQVSNDYVTASAAVTRTVADTLTVSSSSGYQIGAVTPPYGTSALSAGTVTCTAPSGDLQATATSKYLYTGWTLTQIDAGGTATTTTGTGTTCTFTHVAGGSANLVWHHNRYFLVAATPSEAGTGNVEGTGWLAEGSTASLTPVPTDGNEFNMWVSGDLTPDRVKDTPLAFLVTGPFSATAEFCGLRYKWKTYANGYWSAASNWEDLDGDGTGDIPPNDGTATVLFPFGGTGKTYIVTLSGNYASVDVKGLYLEAYQGSYGGASGNWLTLKGTSVTIREGGILMDDSANTVGIKFEANVILPVSQTWKNMSAPGANGNAVNNNALEPKKKLVAGRDVVLTIAGTTPFRPSVTDASEFLGKIRTNCRIYFGATSLFTRLHSPGVFESYPDDTPYTGNYGWLSADATKSSNRIEITAPVRFDAAGSSKILRIQLQVAVDIAGNAWNYYWTGPMSGVFADRKLSIGNVMTSSSQHRSHHPEKQWNHLAGDASGLETNGLPAICFPNGVFTVEHPNALGRDNVLGVYFGGDTAGYYTGIVATNNITVRSHFTMGHEVPVLLGMLEPGEALFTGDVTDNVKSPLFLHAPAGGKARFTGSFTMNATTSGYPLNYPIEVAGGGEIHLEGDNAAVTQQALDVRSATAVLGHANAAGAKPIVLGGTVPVEIPVRVYADRQFSYIDAKIKQETNDKLAWTTTDTAFLLDGVTLEPGDKVLYTPDLADGSNARIYQVDASGNRMEICDNLDHYLAGARIVVTNGTEYAGRAFMMRTGAIGAKGTITCVNDEPEPDVALLAKGGVTVANGIQVTDNLSSGTSTIGGYDATNNTFSGAITLARDVAFRAPAGGVVRLTGSIADAGETLHPFAFSGTGTVELPAGPDMNGRPVSFPGLTDEALDATGRASCTLVSAADGLTTADIAAPSLSKWQLRVKPTSIRAVKNVGTIILMQ